MSIIATIQSAELAARAEERRVGGDRRLSLIKTHLELARLLAKERSRMNAIAMTASDPEARPQ